MPPNHASRPATRYTERDSKHMSETTPESDHSDHDEPERKSKRSEEAGQNSMVSSTKDIRYPAIPSASSRESRENDKGGGEGEKPLPIPAEDESLPRTSRTRTPSPVKKNPSFAIRAKAAEESRTGHKAAAAPTDHDSQSRDLPHQTAVADPKPPASNDSSRSRLDERDRVLPPNPAAGRTHGPAHTAARTAYAENPRTQASLPDVPRTEPRPTMAQKISRGVTQAFYGPPSTNSEPKQQFITERELNDLKTGLIRKDSQLRELEAISRDQKAKIKELQYSLVMAEEARDDIIRKQQEENFKQMDTGRWLPQEESKIRGDLDRLKRSIKSWSKDCSVSSMAPMQNLMGGTEEEIALAQYLSNVVRLDDAGQLPPGLNTSKTPSLLLNALLAHDVYTSLFENPFFFLRDHLAYEEPRVPPDEKFNNIYQSMQASGREAHIWRSQTLRLLCPPLRETSNSTEINLHSYTNSQVVQVSEWHADRFLDGPARHLIHSDSEGQFMQRVKAIYKQAAELSYQLWARRTAIRCITLRQMDPRRGFAVDNPYLEPHTLVRYDDHPDHLYGRPFTVLVHPIVEAFGTDEGEGYEQEGRVWAKGVVWLDSRIDSRRPPQ